MKTFLWTLFVSASLVGCVQGVEQQSTLLEKDNEAEVVGNCFDALVSGPVGADGKMERVSFVNGSCQGTSRALNLIVEKEEVTIQVEGQSYESALYIKGNDVLANAGGQEVKVAVLSDNPADAELSLVAGASVKLKDKRITIAL